MSIDECSKDYYTTIDIPDEEVSLDMSEQGAHQLISEGDQRLLNRMMKGNIVDEYIIFKKVLS